MESQLEQSESQGSSARQQKRKQRATAFEESKAKVRKAKGRNNIDSRNLALTAGRAIFKIIQAARGILLRTLRINRAAHCAWISNIVITEYRYHVILQISKYRLLKLQCILIPTCLVYQIENCRF